jgi:uroporphyrinogen-III decarboxylase
MARNAAVKPKTKVTLALPDHIIQLADLIAEGLGVDRNEVLRLALGQGLPIVRVQQQISENPDRYFNELQAFMAQEPGALQRLADKAGDDTIESLRTQLVENKKA